MKLKLSKIKRIKFSFSLRYFYVLVFMLVIVVISMLGFFLYKNFYQTIAQTEQIILLRKEVAPDTIDINKVNKVLDALDKKTTTTIDIEYSKIKNPFSSKPDEQTTAEVQPTVEN